MKKALNSLGNFDIALWIFSAFLVILSYLLSENGNILSTITSLVGVSALIFVAKGQLFGQFLIVAFAILYSIVSLAQSYYGEMITYLFMSAPMAVFSIISWYRNPYDESGEVRVRELKKGDILILLPITAAVTVTFYFILGALHNASIGWSTLSIATSFVAASLTFLRSPYYALAYAANDIVLIALWIIAALKNPSYFSMIICFVAFLINDIYGYICWRKMQKRQSEK